ncbi:MAG: zinc metallopeptidase [Lachnospiraceae bacterium]|nr:zinc metallopeptidase [Lachnospiraceae bacterium]
MFYYYDPTYILVIIGMCLSLWASGNVNGMIRRYSQVRSKIGITAAEAAERILHSNNIYNVQIKMINKGASDYYNSATKELCLLSSNYNSTSIAAIGIAAHECGHAIQDATGYTPLVLKNSVAPVCSAASNIGVYITIAGILFSIESIIKIGIFLFTLGVLISLLLLPIEYNASNRALAILEQDGMLEKDELYGAKKVLRAAGLTYVAAAAASVLSLLRLIIISRNSRRD